MLSALESLRKYKLIWATHTQIKNLVVRQQLVFVQPIKTELVFWSIYCYCCCISPANYWFARAVRFCQLFSFRLFSSSALSVIFVRVCWGFFWFERMCSSQCTTMKLKSKVNTNTWSVCERVHKTQERTKPTKDNEEEEEETDEWEQCEYRTDEMWHFLFYFVESFYVFVCMKCQTSERQEFFFVSFSVFIWLD